MTGLEIRVRCQTQAVARAGGHRIREALTLVLQLLQFRLLRAIKKQTCSAVWNIVVLSASSRLTMPHLQGSSTSPQAAQRAALPGHEWQEQEENTS